MAKYTRIPQFEHVELQRAVPSGDSDGSNPNTIRSITISKETRADGSVVRHKETLLTNGKTIVEEKELSRPLHDSGIRYVPMMAPIPLTTSSTTDVILPLYHRHPPPLTTKDSSCDHDRDGLICRWAAGLLVILMIFQILLWWMILSGQDNDFPTFIHIFRQFQSKH